MQQAGEKEANRMFKTIMMEQKIIDEVYRSGDVGPLREFVTPASEPVWDNLILYLTKWRKEHHWVQFKVVELPHEILTRSETGMYKSGYHRGTRMESGWGAWAATGMDGWSGDRGQSKNCEKIRITGTPALSIFQYDAGFTRSYPPTHYTLTIFCTSDQVPDVARCIKAAGVEMAPFWQDDKNYQLKQLVAAFLEKKATFADLRQAVAIR